MKSMTLPKKHFLNVIYIKEIIWNWIKSLVSIHLTSIPGLLIRPVGETKWTREIELFQAELEVNEFRFVPTLHPLLPTRWPAVVGTIPSSCPILKH